MGEQKLAAVRREIELRFQEEELKRKGDKEAQKKHDDELREKIRIEEEKLKKEKARPRKTKGNVKLLVIMISHLLMMKLFLRNLNTTKLSIMKKVRMRTRKKNIKIQLLQLNQSDQSLLTNMKS